MFLIEIDGEHARALQILNNGCRLPRMMKSGIAQLLFCLFVFHPFSSHAQTTEISFSWSADRKLTWDDFKGPVNASSAEAAAATNCGFGFKKHWLNGNPVIEVSNHFDVNKSWVRSDAKIESILVHEQGHFDLAEIYTRKLRALLSQYDPNTSNDVLYKVYIDLYDNAYNQRQLRYEDETAHGTDLPAQKRWTDQIKRELEEN